MPSYVMKPRKDRDEYLVYSEVSDSPASEVYTRENMVKFLTEDYWQQHTRTEAEERVERADRMGMSWAWTTHEAWDDQVLVLNGPSRKTDGHYRHRDMAEVTRAYNAEDATALKALMVAPWPPEDEEEGGE